MSRRFGSILTMSTTVLICLSCGKEQPLAPRVESGLTHPVFAQDVEDPGEFHNAIVRAYAHQRPFGSTALLSRREFVHAIDPVIQGLSQRVVARFPSPSGLLGTCIQRRKHFGVNVIWNRS